MNKEGWRGVLYIELEVGVERELVIETEVGGKAVLKCEVVRYVELLSTSLRSLLVSLYLAFADRVDGWLSGLISPSPL